MGLITQRRYALWIILPFCLAGGGARPEVAIWAAGNTVKIGPDEPPPAATYVWDGERLAVRAARGEWASFQVVIRSDEARLVSFQVYDLEGVRGKVPGASVTVFREIYLTITQPSVDPDTGFTVGPGPGRWPDPLAPVVGHVEVAAGENTVLWFDLRVPEDARAGKYLGDLKFKWSGGEYVMPLELTVWDFELDPLAPPPFAAVVEAENVCRLYGIEPDDEKAAALMGKYASLLGQHYVSFDTGGRRPTFAGSEARPARRNEIRGEEGRLGYRAEGLADFIDRPAVDARVLGWALRRFGGDFISLTNVSYFPRKKARPLSDDPRNERGNGAGALIYPGMELGYLKPLPSVRLKLIREAAEDYMYLAKLESAGLGLYADALARGVVPHAPRPGDLAAGEETLYTAREVAARAVVKSRWRQGMTENTVSGRAVSDENLPVAGAVVRAGPLAAVTDREGNYVLEYVPRGRSLTATAPGYEKAGASGAGGRGDFFMKRLLRRIILNGEAPAERYADKGFEGVYAAAGKNIMGGPALVGRLKEGQAGSFEFGPPLRDWNTFGAFVAEVYNGAAGRVTVRLEDEAGAFYEEAFWLPPGEWEAARVDLNAAGRRYFIETRGKGDGLKFNVASPVDISGVVKIKISFEGGGGEIRLGRVWLEAAGK